MATGLNGLSGLIVQLLAAMEQRPEAELVQTRHLPMVEMIATESLRSPWHAPVTLFATVSPKYIFRAYLKSVANSCIVQLTGVGPIGASFRLAQRPAAQERKPGHELAQTLPRVGLERTALLTEDPSLKPVTLWTVLVRNKKCCY